MMKQARVTIPQLAARMYITQARVRTVRERGVGGALYVRDWIQGITGTDPGPVENPARKPAAKPARTRANPAAAKLYTVHTVTGDGKPRDAIAHFRKRADALTYAKAYAKAYGAPVVLTGRAL
jgi:hypothetical protein